MYRKYNQRHYRANFRFGAYRVLTGDKIKVKYISACNGTGFPSRRIRIVGNPTSNVTKTKTCVYDGLTQNGYVLPATIYCRSRDNDSLLVEAIQIARNVPFNRIKTESVRLSALNDNV